MPEPTFDELIDAMKAAVGVLREGGIPFALGGGLAAWARGGPKSEHDVDLARALREQIDWREVQARTESSPFARAFFTLVLELGIVSPGQLASRLPSVLAAARPALRETREAGW